MERKWTPDWTPEQVAEYHLIRRLESKLCAELIRAAKQGKLPRDARKALDKYLSRFPESIVKVAWDSIEA